MIPLTIRHAVPDDYADWRVMWDFYCAFYETTIPEDVTQQSWARICDPVSPVKALMARHTVGGEALGMCNYILHDNTWTLGPVCYLEDLFTHRASRGQGVGKALVDELLRLGRAHGWARLYWMTRNNNTTARRLYDQYTSADDFVRYMVRL
ncbi:MAG TPA: GNAT family N-acetyltransferase [Alphaproteobacteria bacterium]|nr:GNAT family N-acetyltransferase [Alphaproteobacteria bacterium]HAJ46065.1 GNAT family N-acetyltransferase [Alphaproteobacteria bacterium]